MHILVLLTDLFGGIGGIQTFNRCLVKALDEMLKEKDWKITLLVMNDPLDSYVTGLYFNSERIKYFPFNRQKLRFIISTFLKSLRASILIFGHVNFVPLAIFLRFISQKIKMFMILYDVNIKNKFSFLQNIGIKQINKIISISTGTQRLATSINKLYSSQFDILPCTLEPDYGRNVILQTREKLKLPLGQMILTVSRLNSLHRFKNIDLVIKSMPDILKEIPDAFYVIVGDGTDRPRLKKLAEDLGLNEKVIFTGQVEKKMLPSYYDSCDIFVLPSSNEGFGIVFLEAMYYSKPCIGARAGGITDVIENKKTGILCTPDDINDLTSSIITLLQNDKLRLSLGLAGKEKLEKEFSFENFQKKVKRILD